MPKVLYIGFGASPIVQGGAVIYQESLAEKISGLGWETACFFGMPGNDYAVRKRPYTKIRYKDKVKIIELYNSPNKVRHYVIPEQQCLNPRIDLLTEHILDEERPDIVHIHELQMHAASIIDIICRRGLPALKTTHNYFDICPQRDLMFQGRQPCLDFNRGERCGECLPALSMIKEMPLINRVVWNFLPERLYGYLSALYKKIRYKRDDQKMAAQEIYRPYHGDRYAYRRKFFVERLNRLDCVQCSSFRSAQILINQGVSRDKIKVISLSVKSIEKISARPLRDNHHPIVFGYAGGEHPSRGYRVLIDAFSKLDQTKAMLIIWGVADPEISVQGLNMELRPRYQPEDINRVFGEIDIGIIPSVWEEIFGIIGIELLAARIPVIGSDIGGIPDWLKDGENGFLVPAGDAEALAEKMKLFIDNPELAAKLQRQIKPQKTLDEHVNEIARLYRDIIAKKRGYLEVYSKKP